MRRPVVALCCLAALLLPAWASAQSPDAPPSNQVKDVEEPAELEPAPDASAEYERHVKEGKEKYINEDLVGAVLSFESAYKIRANPKLLYNIGRIFERMSKFNKAIEHYDKFIHSPDVDLELRQDAMTRLKTLREIEELDGQNQSQASASDSAQQSDVASADLTTREYQADYTSAWITIPAGVATTALIGGGFHLMSNSEAASANEPGMEVMRDTHLANADKYQLVSYIGYGLGGALTALGIYFAIDPPMEPVTTASAGDSDSYNARMTAGPSANGDGFSIGFDMSF